MTENQAKAKRLLDDIKTSDAFIKSKKLKVKLLTAKVEGGSIRYDKENVKTSCSNFTEEMLAEIADLEMEIEEDLAQVDTKYSDAYRIINNNLNYDEQNVLIGYYFDGYTYEELADMIHVSRRTIYRIEDDALEHLGNFL